MGDFGDFDIDDLIEEDQDFGGGDVDEEEMIMMQDDEQTAGAVGSGGATATVTAPATATAPDTAGVDDDDLDWIGQQAGATQADGGERDFVYPDEDENNDSEDEDDLHLFQSFKPPPLSSNARADDPKKSAMDIEGDAVVVTSADGNRAFVRAEPKNADPSKFGYGKDASKSGQPPNARLSNNPKSSFLLGESIDMMLDRLENSRREEALKKSKELEERGKVGAKASLDKKMASKSSRRSSTGKMNLPPPGLWVDAHAPKNFTELLSAENVNKEVLHWLKAWDGVVFKRAPPKPARDVRFGGRGGRDGGRGDFRGRGRGGGANGYQGNNSSHNTHVPLDPDGRPSCKILLLSGPPGVGKTTLAHVAARHAGYRVVEVNASDDRSAEALRSKVTDATQMQSLSMGSNDKNRPNCVVIDEIDGALGGSEGRGAINALLQVVNGTRGPKSLAQYERERNLEDDETADGTMRTTKHDGSKHSKGFNASKRKGPGPLMRPIICICNDPYAPALRQLREVAKVFKVQPPSSARLNGRLREVCSKRGMVADTRALGFLAERSEGDIRACLNALQMINQEGKGLTLKDVDNGSGGDSSTKAAIGAACGEKDLTVQARGLWQTLLSGHIANKRTRKASRDKHQANLVNQCFGFGDDQLLIDGLFENVHSAKFQDASMGKVAEALDALCFGDFFSTAVRQKQQYHLMPHVTSSVMQMHSTLNNAPAVSNFLEWPQGGKVTREKLKRRDTLRHWSSNTKPLNGHSLAVVSNQTLACEIAPYVLTTIAPEIRPVSANFMKPHEASLLRSTVSTMAQLGLTYAAPVESPNQSAQNAFRGVPQTLQLEPAIDDLVLFGAGVPMVNLEPGSSKFGGNGWKSGSFNSSSHTHSEKKHDASLSFVQRRFLPIGTKQMLAHEVKLEAIRRAERSMHGPGTPLSNPEKKATVDENKNIAAKRLAAAMGGLGPTARSNAKKAKANSLGVSYKYNEGFTNAVRRAVFLRDLA